jgi:hypothetical protein
MPEPPKQKTCRWALALSLAAHLLLLYSFGMRGVPDGDAASAGRTMTRQVKISLIEPARPAPADAAPPVMEKPVPAPQDTPSDPSFPPSPPVGGPDSVFEILAKPEPYYFPTNALAEKPQVTIDVPPMLATPLPNESPDPAILRLRINELGMIDEVVIEKSSLSEPARRLITEAFGRMRFEPGKIDGKAVKSELRIEIRLEDIPFKPLPKRP